MFNFFTSRFLKTSGVFLNFLFDIDDSYVFASRVSFQLNISSFEGFYIFIKGFHVLDVVRFQSPDLQNPENLVHVSVLV